MDFETYKRKLLEENERNRLSELQTKYNGVETPDYENMSLRDELQTRFDLDELNNLQQKYGVQQTPASQPQVTASVSQPSYGQQTSSQQPNSQPSTWDNTLRKLKDGALGIILCESSKMGQQLLGILLNTRLAPWLK